MKVVGFAAVISISQRCKTWKFQHSLFQIEPKETCRNSQTEGMVILNSAVL